MSPFLAALVVTACASAFFAAVLIAIAVLDAKELSGPEDDNRED